MIVQFQDGKDLVNVGPPLGNYQWLAKVTF